MPIARYETMSAFADTCEAANLPLQGRGNGLDWTSGETIADSIHLTRAGSDKYAEAARAMVERISAITHQEERKVFAPSVMGAYPCVPDYLAGFPENMRAMQPTTDERAPIRVYVCIVSSGGIDARPLARRGAAISALVERLSETRAVELWALHTSDANQGSHRDDSLIAVRLPTAPMSLAHVAYALSSQGYTRGLNYCMSAKLHGSALMWPQAYGFEYGGDYAKYFASLRTRLGLSDSDLIVPPIKLSDPIAKDPIGWTVARLKEITRSAD